MRSITKLYLRNWNTFISKYECFCSFIEILSVSEFKTLFIRLFDFESNCLCEYGIFLVRRMILKNAVCPHFRVQKHCSNMTESIMLN